MKRVLIIEAQIKQYRAPFYAQLHEALQTEGIELRVAYGDPPPAESRKNDTCDLSHDYGKKVGNHWFCMNRLLYQPLLIESLKSDLVIVDQGNKYLLNYALLPLSRLGLRKIAFWGLGENRQAGQIRVSEWYRRTTLNWVSWWFAYTKGTARYLQEHGVPPSKITAVQNSVDTREIRECVRALSSQDRTALRASLGIPPGAPVGIFCGMLDRVKSLPFLIESSRIIRARIPAFHLILVGGGPEQDSVHRLAEDFDWVHMVGPQFGKRKAEFMAVSDAFLLPGRVGLAILDAFAAGLPMLATDLSIHGPEMEYLEEGVNGLKSEPQVGAYAEAVASVLSRGDRLRQLQEGAEVSSGKYSIENMVDNFATGILACLSPTRQREWIAENMNSPR
jgi:glycosyltransferase involved in cell wall biosynthesis